MKKSRGIICSAPGKILISGGYVILSEKNFGFPIAVDSKIHAIFEFDWQYTGNKFIIRLENPQLENEDYEFEIIRKDYKIILEQIKSKNESKRNRNIIIENAIIYALRYVELKKKIRNESWVIRIRMDKEFYPVGYNAICKELKDGYLKYSVHVEDLIKSGLGSSAALTVALISTILINCQIFPEPEIIASLGVLSHNHSQGKLGSGFDVITSTFGTNIFKSISPDQIRTSLELAINSKTPENFEKAVEDLSIKIKNSIKRVKIPEFIKVVLIGSVYLKGSSTKVMSLKIREWEKKSKSCKELSKKWKEKSNELTNSLLEFFNLINEISSCTIIGNLLENGSTWLEIDNYEENSPHVKLIEKIKMVRNNSRDYRGILKEVTLRSDCKIEPIEISPILDKILEIPGVLLAVIPGAGGYDGIATIVLDQSVIHTIFDVLKALNCDPKIILVSSFLNGISIS